MECHSIFLSYDKFRIILQLNVTTNQILKDNQIYEKILKI